VSSLRLDKVPSETTEFIWDPYFPIGEMALIEGASGRGKTLFILKIIALLSRGDPLPGDSTKRLPLSSLIFTTENHPNRALRPQLEAMGANLKKVRLYRYSNELEKEGIPFLHRVIRRARPHLIFFDPILQYLDAGLDINSASKVRNSLWQLAEIFDERECAMVLLRHTAKGEKPMQEQGAGSAQWDAVVRSTSRIAKAPMEATPTIFPVAICATRLARRARCPDTWVIAATMPFSSPSMRLSSVLVFNDSNYLWHLQTFNRLLI
jgi:RecA-family ATPase